MRTRREFLFSGISLPALLAAAGAGGRAKNCIIYFQEGGACQHDSFDPKPEQPLEIRGVHKTIPTAIPTATIGRTPLTSTTISDIISMHIVSDATIICTVKVPRGVVCIHNGWWK